MTTPINTNPDLKSYRFHSTKHNEASFKFAYSYQYY